MRTPHLSKSPDSPYFWPGVGLSVIGILFFAWAVLISSQDWVGQAIWGALATVIAVVLLAAAGRHSRRALSPAA
jgi:drug/metabolite transporter (DMT)-like permease